MDRIKAIVVAIGSLLMSALGVLAVPVLLLVTCNFIDYITGLIASKFRNQEIDSYKGIRGIAKKICMWLLVGVGVIVDQLLSYSADVAGIRLPFTFLVACVVAIWLICNEIISILENINDIGVTLPPFLQPIVSNLKSQVEKKAAIEDIKIIQKKKARNKIMKRGIDISRHQGELDFDYIAANFDYVIIRCAYGNDLSEDDSECSQCDSMAQTYIDECEKRGIQYGLYIYQYAGNNDESLSEAAHIREWYNKCNPTMGLYLDIEDADGYKAEHGIDYHYTQELALTWLDALCDITAKGIYASHSWLNDYMNVDELIEHGALIWEAHWNDDGEICEDKFAMSQESSDYYLDDGTRVDYDIMYDEVYDRLTKANEYDHRNDDVEDNDNADEDNNVGADETDTEQLQHEIGDYVEYNVIYASSTSEAALTPSAGFNSGRITRVIPWASNPYLIDDGTGWVNDGCIVSAGDSSDGESNEESETDISDIKAGDKVRVLLNVDYDTDRAFNLYYDEYDVIQVNGDRAVIGIGNTVTSAIDVHNIERI